MDDLQEEGFAGTLINFRLTDLIQMCCISNQSQCINVTKGKDCGFIVIEEGEIIHAVCGELKGEDAFFTILLWDKGRFETTNLTTSHELTISKNYQYLLMEAARLEDEQAASKEPEQLTDENVQEKIRVMIVDDSPTMCRILSSAISSDENLEIVGTADNGESALKQLAVLKPDLITMDVNMPVMDGGTALRHIMLKSPCPVVIISSPGSRTDRNVLDFLRLGAVDFIEKPMHNNEFEFEKKLITRVKKAAAAKTINFVRARAIKRASKPVQRLEPEDPARVLVLIFSGMGGFAELLNTVSHLPAESGVCSMAFQDLPKNFIRPMSSYLDKISPFFVEPLAVNASLDSDLCLIGTSRDAGKISVVLKESTPVIEETLPVQKKGFDHFLESALKVYKGKLVLILLSGAEIKNKEILRLIGEKGAGVILQKATTCMFPPLAISDAQSEPCFSEPFFMEEAGPEEIKNRLLALAKN